MVNKYSDQEVQDRIDKLSSDFELGNNPYEEYLSYFFLIYLYIYLYVYLLLV